MRNYLSLLRVHQYVKNLFIFLPLFFAGEAANVVLALDALIAFAAFSLVSSSMYIINDCLDAPYDREHPVKRDRPIAAGRIPVKTALLLSAVLLVLGTGLMYMVGRPAMMVMLVYLALNIAYNLGLKHLTIIDVAIVASGFVLRLFVGAVATGVALSMWMVSMTFLLAFFLAVAKRRDDVLIFERTGKMMRKSIDGYNSRFLDATLSIMASIVIVAYMMYAVSEEVVTRIGSDKLYLTTLFVILGVLRYLQLTFVEEKSGSPTKVLLGDRFTQINLACWLLAFWALLY